MQTISNLSLSAISIIGCMHKQSYLEFRCSASETAYNSVGVSSKSSMKNIDETVLEDSSLDQRSIIQTRF